MAVLQVDTLAREKPVPSLHRDTPGETSTLGGIPNLEHDESLFLEKREQMFYNVENPNRVETKYQIPPRAELLRPDFHNEMSRYQSELMFRRDTDTI